jgi:hypothetical protein
VPDLEEQLGRVWNSDVRPLVQEAWRCYAAGANRACITLTWVAVCADLIYKIDRLADDGDGAAIGARNQVASARAAGLTSAGVREMQEIERTILATSVELELVDGIAARELDRLREDRHLCAHSSLRSMGEMYDPRPESARAHLAAALDSVLTHPAVQGKKVVDGFAAHVADPYFVDAPGYLARSYFERVRPVARRRIVDLAAKHALLELPAPDPPGSLILADRMAACLRAFANRDRTMIRDALLRSLDRFRQVDGASLLRAVGRLGDLDLLWTIIDDPISERLGALISAMSPPTGYGDLAEEDAAVLSLVCRADARARLPILETRFASLPTVARAGVMGRRIDAYFIPLIPTLLREAPSWRSAEAFTRQAVVPYGPFLSEPDLVATLKAWAETHDCRTAGGMLNLSVELYRATGHLHPVDAPVWRSFIDEVRQSEGASSPFQYTELEAELP